MSKAVRQQTMPLMALAFLGLIGMVSVTIWLIVQQGAATSAVRHTLDVEHRLTALLSSLQDAETGQRGFLLSRDRSFLVPFERAQRDLPREIAELRAAVNDNPEQIRRIDGVDRLVQSRLIKLFDRVREVDAGRAIDVAQLQAGKRIMDALRIEIAAMIAQEQQLLSMREAQVRRWSDGVIAGLIVTAIGIVAISILVLRQFSAQIAALRTSGNDLVTANAALREEATRRAAAEAQARQLQKMEAVGQLTGGIAHDFNNMLAIVVGSLDLARRRLGKGEADKAADCIDNAMEGATRASQLTARLMAFSRQTPLEPQVTDANKLVGGMSELLRRTIGEQIMVETVLAGGLWKTMVDPSQLENALVNLAVNGRDAMPDGGRLTIETANAELDDRYAEAHDEVAAGQYVMISVTDAGTGMPPEIVDRVFEPFYTTKGVGKGTGLGLSQVFGFVKQSKGHIKIYSEVGQGTAVKLYLPRSTNERVMRPAKAAVSDDLDALPHARGEEIILVVEDDERVRHTSVDALRELGYTVVQASDALQALAVIEVQPKIDLVFTDVVMPEMNGRQLVEEIGRLWPGLRILYTTGYTRNAIVHNGTLDQGVALLSKPFTIEQLALKVRQVLDRA